MCVTIYANLGDIEIETPRQIREMLGIEPVRHIHYADINPDTCLCQVDVDKTLENANIRYYYDHSDYYLKEFINAKP